MRRATGLTAIAVIALVSIAQPAWAQRPPPELPTYGHTLMQGSGYIVTPHGLVSRSSLFITGTVIAPEGFQPAAGDPRDSYTVARAAVGLTLANFLEVGAYGGSKNGPGLFGKIQIIRQTGIWPAIALGVQNLSTANNGRYGIEDDFYNDIQEAATLYGVFTYVAGPGKTSFPIASISRTASSSPVRGRQPLPCSSPSFFSSSGWRKRACSSSTTTPEPEVIFPSSSSASGFTSTMRQSCS